MHRDGIGPLQGRVNCGLCGKRMRVRYQEVARAYSSRTTCAMTPSPILGASRFSQYVAAPSTRQLAHR